MRFEYCDVTSLDEAVSLLKQHGDGAYVLAGGTDILVMAKEDRVRPSHLIDIKPVSGLDDVTSDGRGVLKIGALATIRSLDVSTSLREKAPAVSRAAHTLGSVQIRNRATIGGNVCQAVPSAEMPPALIALGAEAIIYGTLGHRRIPLEQLFVGPRRTSLAHDEILTGLEIPPALPNTGSAYLRFSPRQSMDLAVASAAATITLDNGKCSSCRIVLGAVAPVPLRATRAEDSLKGEKLDDAGIQRAAQLASSEASPISDIRASSEYRRELVKVLVGRALAQAVHAATHT